MIDEKYFKNIDLDKLSKDELEDMYVNLNEFNEYIYDFVLNYYKYIYKTKDYGMGLNLSMLEVHLITDIADNPGITANLLAKKWKKTAAFISQSISKLDKLGLIYRELNEENKKYYNIYLTDKGYELDIKHKKYDICSITRTNRELMKKYSLEEIIKMRIIMKDYLDIVANEED